MESIFAALIIFGIILKTNFIDSFELKRVKSFLENT